MERLNFLLYFLTFPVSSVILIFVCLVHPLTTIGCTASTCNLMLIIFDVEFVVICQLQEKMN